MLSDATEYMDILFAMLDEVFAGATSRRTGRKGIDLDHNRVVPTWTCPIVSFFDVGLIALFVRSRDPYASQSNRFSEGCSEESSGRFAGQR